MDRRDFLKSTGAAAAAAAATAGQALADAAPLAAPNLNRGHREFRLALTWPDTCAGPSESARRLAAAIERDSDRRFKFSFLSATTGSDAIGGDQADFTFGSAHEAAASEAAFAYFGGLPGQHGLAPRHLQQWLMVGGGETLWDELAAAHGLKSILAGHTGESAGLWSRAPIADASALQSQRIWASGLARDVVRGLGAEPSDLVPADVAVAVASGEVFAVDAGGMIAAYSMGLMDAAPQRVPCAITPFGTALALTCKRAVWESMTRADQALIQAAAQAEFQTMVAEEAAHGPLFPVAAPTPGARRAAVELAHAVHHVSDAVVAHLASANSRTARINASYMAFRGAVTGGENVA